MGIDERNIFIMENGRVLEIDNNSAKMLGMVPSGKLLVDGLGVGDVGNIVLRDRKHLSNDGLIVCVVSISEDTGEIVAGPDIISRGFVYVREAEDLMEEARKVTKAALDKCIAKGATDWSGAQAGDAQTL